ncbi:hypothetical protein ASA1KI_33460 [Opitutales bacterium ASA1]|uniref:hypothetical protein n=1 Tax=Congregicoccus parvus TaxID=3081749 RepID=UPI002B2C88F1|nr:hypothetical protein ASA1KI_33460 [Opitutales bacterium ASA1]
MKKSTVTLITVLVLAGSHVIAHFFGSVGIVVALASAGVFCGVAGVFYRRALKRLHASTRDLSPLQREAVFEVAALDAEARRDLNELDRKVRASERVRREAERDMRLLRPTDDPESRA